MVVLWAYSSHLTCLFPQHGAGKKHERRIALEPWQQELVAAAPWAFLRGCIRSDGSVFVNRTGRYEYLSYDFCNLSQDILGLFEDCLASGSGHGERRRGSVSTVARTSHCFSTTSVASPEGHAVPSWRSAAVAELVDARASGARELYARGGSSPLSRMIRVLSGTPAFGRRSPPRSRRPARPPPRRRAPTPGRRRSMSPCRAPAASRAPAELSGPIARSGVRASGSGPDAGSGTRTARARAARGRQRPTAASTPATARTRGTANPPMEPSVPPRQDVRDRLRYPEPGRFLPLSSRGLGRRPLTAETGVRIPVAVLTEALRIAGFLR